MSTPSSLSSQIRTLQSAYGLSCMVFGSGVDVGKSIVCSGLARAALQKDRRVCYLKPIQTGPGVDEYFVQLYTNPQGTSDITLKTLYHYPGSQGSVFNHIKDKSGLVGNNGVLSDDRIVRSIATEIKLFSSSTPSSSSINSKRNNSNSSNNDGSINLNFNLKQSLPNDTNAAFSDLRNKVRSKDVKHRLDRKKHFTIVETIGGPLSPGPSQTLQADIYRPLRLPILLVGDPRLGGITATLAAYESLTLRGYTVHAIALAGSQEHIKYENADKIRSHFTSMSSSKSRFPFVFSFSPLKNERLLHTWFRENDSNFASLFDMFENSVSRELISSFSEDIFDENLLVSAPLIIESSFGNKRRCMKIENTGGSAAASGVGGGSVSSNMTMTTNINDFIDQDSDIVFFPDLIDAQSCGKVLVGLSNTKLASAMSAALSRFGSSSSGSPTRNDISSHVSTPSTSSSFSSSATSSSPSTNGGRGEIRYRHSLEIQLEHYLKELGPGKGWADHVLSDTSEADMWARLLTNLRSSFSPNLKCEKETKSSAKTMLSSLNPSDVSINSGNDNSPLVIGMFKGSRHENGRFVGVSGACTSTAHHAARRYHVNEIKSFGAPYLQVKNGVVSVSLEDIILDGGIGYLTKPIIKVYSKISDLYDVSSRLSSDTDLYQFYSDYCDAILSSLSIKSTSYHPLGFVFIIEALQFTENSARCIDPLFTRILNEKFMRAGVRTVFDEVFSSNFAMGYESSIQNTSACPYAMAMGESLVNGCFPLFTTLLSSPSIDKDVSLTHDTSMLINPSLNTNPNLLNLIPNPNSVFYASPAACALALETVRLLKKMQRDGSLTTVLPSSSPSPSTSNSSFSPSFIEDKMENLEISDHEANINVNIDTKLRVFKDSKLYDDIPSVFSDNEVKAISSLKKVNWAMSKGSYLVISFFNRFDSDATYKALSDNRILSTKCGDSILLSLSYPSHRSNTITSDSEMCTGSSSSSSPSPSSKKIGNKILTSAGRITGSNSVTCSSFRSMVDRIIKCIENSCS